MSIQVSIKGHEQVGNNIIKIGQEVPKSSQQALQNAANNVVTIARQNAPFDTGFLRSSIEVESVTVSEAKITAGADYAAVQEDRVGYMASALDSNAATFLQELQRSVAAAIKAK